MASRPTQRTNNNANASGGSVDVAGALAFNFLTTGAKAYIDPNGAGTATVDVDAGALTLDASSTDVVGATADGEKVGDGSELGVAVAVNVILPTHEVYLGNQVTLTAGSVTLQATSPNPDTYTVSAKSGAGGDGADLAVAGSLAVNVLVGRHSADIRPARDRCGRCRHGRQSEGGDELDDDDGRDSRRRCREQCHGVGASVALSIVDDITTTALRANSTLTGTCRSPERGISTSIEDDQRHHDQREERRQEGRPRARSVIAITVSNIDTEAVLETGSPLTVESSWRLPPRLQESRRGPPETSPVPPTRRSGCRSRSPGRTTT